MTTQLTNHGGKATLTLVGRLDTMAAQALNAELEQRLSECGSFESLVVDANGPFPDTYFTFPVKKLTK